MADCAAPASGVEFSLIDGNGTPASVQTDDDGEISFTGVEPGYYTLSAERPGDFETSRVRCRNAIGDVLVARTATSQLAMLVARGDEVACTWYLVQTETQDATPLDPTPSPAAVTATEGVDADGDRLTDEQETALGTDPEVADSDEDDVSDSDEIDFYGTDALDPDTDGDELDDGEELLTFGTNPLLDDTDGDGVSDGEETSAGTDPLDAVSVPPTPTPNPTSTPEPTVEPTPEATPALPSTSMLTPNEATDRLDSSHD